MVKLFNNTVASEYHRQALIAHSNAYPDHRPNIDAQHEKTIYHLECVESCVIVLMIHVKLYYWRSDYSTLNDITSFTLPLNPVTITSVKC